MRTSNDELQAIVERINRKYADELTAETSDGETVEFEIFHSHESNVHRAKVTPADNEYGSWQADLGPGFRDRNELVAFLRGLEYGKDVGREARLL